MHTRQRYEAYIDSGIDWLGRPIPETWQVKRIKDLSFLRSGSSIVSEQIEVEGDYPVYGGNGLRGFYSEYTNDGSYILIGRQGALCGNINYATGKFWASEHAVVVYINNLVNMKWFGELLRTMNLNQYSLSAAQPGLAIDRIKRLLVPFPPLEEQTAIADYLDRHTGLIDRKIGLLRRKAARYGSLKQALINETVTRGLDAAAPLKDSGVEWIGQIPAHWEMKRLEDVSLIIDPQPDHRAPALAEKNGYPYIGIRDLNTDGTLNFDSARKVDIAAVEKQERAFKVVLGDILFCKVGTLGEPRIIIPSGRFALSATLVLIKVKSKTSNIFLRYALDSSCILNQINHFGSGSTRPALGIKQIRKFLFPLPSLQEQISIAAYLDEKTAQIDRIVSAINAQIDTLAELRKTLINDVVTGKIKIC